MFKHHSTPTLTLFPYSSPQFKCIIISLYYVFFLFDDDSFPLPLFLFFSFNSCYCWCLLLLLLVLLMLLLLLPLGSFFHFFCISSFLYAHSLLTFNLSILLLLRFLAFVAIHMPFSLHDYKLCDF